MEGRTVFAALLSLVVGAGVGWMLKPTDGSDSSSSPRALTSEEAAAQPTAPQPELGSDVTVLRAELDTARRALDAEKERRKGAEEENATLRTQVAALREAATKGIAPDAPAVSKGVRYGYDRYKKTLEAIDWDVAGDAITHITPILEALVNARAAGKPLPPSIGNLQRYNGPLVTAALTASQNGVPGTGVNGAFTHPAMLANMVYATLLKAGTPLSEAQEKKLKALADDFVREDEQRMGSYDESALGLQKLLDETALKDRLFAAIDALLTDAQRSVLHPEVVRGRTSADLFSSGVIWGTVIRPARFTSAEQLSGVLTRQIVARYQVPEDQRSTVEDLAGEWLKSFPSSYLDAPADALTSAGHYEIGRVRTAAERQLVFFQRLLDRLPADWAGAEQFRQETFVLLPLKSQ